MVKRRGGASRESRARRRPPYSPSKKIFSADSRAPAKGATAVSSSLRRPRFRDVPRARLPLGLDGPRALLRLRPASPRRAPRGARSRAEVPRRLASRDRDPGLRRARRIRADRPLDSRPEEGARKGSHPGHVRPRPQHALSGVRARRRRVERRDGDRHRRERPRLLRLPRLPPGIPRGRSSASRSSGRRPASRAGASRSGRRFFTCRKRTSSASRSPSGSTRASRRPATTREGTAGRAGAATPACSGPRDSQRLESSTLVDSRALRRSL